MKCGSSELLALPSALHAILLHFVRADSIKSLREREAELKDADHRSTALKTLAVAVTHDLEGDVQSFAAKFQSPISTQVNQNVLTLRRNGTKEGLTITCFADESEVITFNISGPAVNDRSCDENQMLDEVIALIKKSRRD